MTLEIFPCDLDEANAFVKRYHRHLGAVVGHKYSLCCAVGETVVGVAIVGRPVARMEDDGLTLEVLRVATQGTKNACSFLYGACRRACFALGYKRLVTCNLPEESGASLRAAGFRCIGEAGGGSWSRIGRPRVDKHPLQPKFKWESVP